MLSEKTIAWLKWLGASVVVMGLVVAAIVHGQETIKVKRWRKRQSEAKLRFAKAKKVDSETRAAIAKSEAEAKRHRRKAAKLGAEVTKIEKKRTELTGDYSAAAQALRDEEYARFSNARADARARSESVG